jgi:hypothetical protein
VNFSCRVRALRGGVANGRVGRRVPGLQPGRSYYSGTEENHTNPTRQRGPPSDRRQPSLTRRVGVRNGRTGVLLPSPLRFLPEARSVLRTFSHDCTIARLHDSRFAPQHSHLSIFSPLFSLLFPFRSPRSRKARSCIAVPQSPPRSLRYESADAEPCATPPFRAPSTRTRLALRFGVRRVSPLFFIFPTAGRKR